MAIDLNNLKGVNPNQNNVSQNRGTASAPKADAEGVRSQGGGEGGSDGDDSVQLSPEVQALQAVEARVQNVPEVDTERVEAIRNAIEDGSFEINNDRLASRLVSLERLLGG